MRHIRRQGGLVVVILVLAIALFASRAEALSDSVIGVSEEGKLDVAFGRALDAASEVASGTGAKAFVLESISGLRGLEGKQNRIVIRLALRPALDPALIERASGRATASIDELVKTTKLPLEMQREAREIPDFLAQYHIAHIVGQLSEGGVPPVLYAISEAGESPALGEGDAAVRWHRSGKLADGDWQSDLDAALADAARAMPEGTTRFAWRAVGWFYQLGGIAGLRDTGLTIEARPVPESIVPATLPADPKQAVDVLRSLIKAHDWPALARFYDLEDSAIDPSELLSGVFFHRLMRPLDADPAGLWHYRQPFHPLASLIDVMVPAAALRLVAAMEVEIDQGEGPKQRVQSQFWLLETPQGLRLLPN